MIRKEKFIYTLPKKGNLFILYDNINVNAMGAYNLNKNWFKLKSQTKSILFEFCLV